ncbi:hypothetical protein M8C21_028724 [Ambrosia artemisiifolia]|uniref:Uncharacterized protein n=1 Tax=Ambrosia artemisiifolia TaxID=4212 RepID=A0AAD5C0B2_AMBAR|nr:hypothetical protein M8C21_028724 [Ambrosia artemisiifolia]
MLFKAQSNQWWPSIVLFVGYCCKLLYNKANSIPSNLDVWHIYWLDLPQILSKEIGFKGDPSDEYAFSTFFPELIRAFRCISIVTSYDYVDSHRGSTTTLFFVRQVSVTTDGNAYEVVYSTSPTQQPS